MALTRFNFLKKRLQRDTKLHQKYKEAMTGYLKSGYARKLSKKEVDEVSRRTWYLPHHPIFNENKPNKMRIVFDAAGEYDGMSLNKALLTGPDLQNNLVGVLLRFRNHTFAIAADIEAMYHQIRISKSDANSLRFFWQDDLTQDVPEIYQMVVHIFGGKDSPCCANYALKKIGRDDFDEYDASTIESVLKSFYMDDFLKLVISEMQAITLCQEMIQVMESSGFNLTKFINNSDRVSKALSNNKYEKTTQDLEIDAEIVEKTLGIPSYSLSLQRI